jgi:hypothetical protein
LECFDEVLKEETGRMNWLGFFFFLLGLLGNQILWNKKWDQNGGLKSVPTGKVKVKGTLMP